LDTRLAKHVLARTSVIVHANDNSATSDGGWRTNNAGLTFNQNYGFGMVNASAFVDMVPQFEVTPLVETNSGTINVSSTIPNNDPNGITMVVDNTLVGELEEVMLTLNVSHLNRGQIEAFVTSPSGYVSRMMYRANDSGDNINWTFLSNAFWGEQAAGQWSVMVRDTALATTGTWNSYSMTWRTGTIVPTGVPEPGTGTILTFLALLITARRRRG
jgi:kexin